jgi:ketosteroid isomerase-like protein
MGALLDHVRSYYGVINSGDVDAIAGHFTDDAVHYYTRMAPHRGREIAERAVWAVQNMEAEWSMYNGIDDGEQAVIEWAMKWRHPETGELRLDRGTEWFLFRDGKICEVRAYYNRSGDLIDFDHAGRGHTVLEQ